MKLLTEIEAKTNEAATNAMADYNRAVILYQHCVMTSQEFTRIVDTISQVFITAIESVKVGEKND